MSEKAPTEKKWDVYGYEEHLRTLTPEKILGELLATLHRDGGHHTEEVGLAQSVIDAMNNYMIAKSALDNAIRKIESTLTEES